MNIANYIKRADQRILAAAAAVTRLEALRGARNPEDSYAAVQEALANLETCCVEVLRPIRDHYRRILRRGVCRFCGCTDERACPNGCAWYDTTETVCDSPSCVAKLKAEKVVKA